VGENSLPGYGPVNLMNRPMRTRVWGGVGAGGEKPPATRLEIHTKFLKCCFWGQKGVFKHKKRPFLRVKCLIIAVFAWSDKNSRIRLK
jgi:hypothetical protein